MIKWGLGLAATLCVLGATVSVWLWQTFQLPAPPEPTTTGFVLSDVVIINPMIDRSAPTSLTVSDGVISLQTNKGDLSTLDVFSGRYVLPGFIDMHTHLPGDNALKLTQHYGLLHLAHGVTTIRDAGDIDGTAVPAARALIADGGLFPDLISCGPFVSSGVSVWPNSVQYTHTEQAPQVVAAIAAAGHGCIKSYEGLTPQLISALVAAASAEGLHVIGHVPIDFTIEQAGVPDVQHFFGVPEPSTLGGESVVYRNGDWSGVDEERLRTVVTSIIASGIKNTPTMTTLQGFLGFAHYTEASALSDQVMPSFYSAIVWNPKSGLPVYRDLPTDRFAGAAEALRKKQALAKRLSDGGAILHIGTDVGQPFTAPGVSFWREMRLFEEAGISAEQVLAYATNVAGASLGADVGVIADGAPADFLVFREDPTKSLDALESLEAVVLNGQLFTKAELDKAVYASLAHYEAWPMRSIARSAAQRTIDETAKNF
ncbi:MAG: amidohydrolase family protein [Pseudomonadota bacterium]